MVLLQGPRCKPTAEKAYSALPTATLDSRHSEDDDRDDETGGKLEASLAVLCRCFGVTRVKGSRRKECRPPSLSSPWCDSRPRKGRARRGGGLTERQGMHAR